MYLPTSGFTLPLLHPFAMLARRARRRSPAAAAKQIRLLHPIHQEGVFLVHQKLGRFWSTRKLSTCSHFEGDCTYKKSWAGSDILRESQPGARSSMAGEMAEWQRCHCAFLLPNDSIVFSRRSNTTWSRDDGAGWNGSSSHVAQPPFLLLVLRYVLGLRIGLWRAVKTCRNQSCLFLVVRLCHQGIRVAGNGSKLCFPGTLTVQAKHTDSLVRWVAGIFW